LNAPFFLTECVSFSAAAAKADLEVCYINDAAFDDKEDNEETSEQGSI
jgi:hypothetical protein